MKGCPFCRAVPNTFADRPADFFGDAKGCAVICPKCGASGPPAVGGECNQAEEAWDSRWPLKRRGFWVIALFAASSFILSAALCMSSSGVYEAVKALLWVWGVIISITALLSGFVWCEVNYGGE